MSHRASVRVLLLSTLVASTFGYSAVAQAGTPSQITVTTTTDELVVDGDCSLREAVRAANTDVAVDQCGVGNTFGTDTILLQEETYALSLGPAGDDGALTGDLDITGSTNIVGGSSTTTIIEVNRTAFEDRVIDIVGSPTVTLQGLSVRNGSSPGFGNHGGGIRNTAGNLSLDFVSVRDNDAGGVGAGIYSTGSLSLTNSNVLGNVTTGNGAGGIHIGSVTATLDVSGSGFQTNVGNLGGAITNYGTTTIDESSLINNDAGSGAAIYNGGGGGMPSVSVTDTTFFFNEATASGGAIWNSGAGIFTVDRSVFELNQADRAGAIGNEAILTVTNSTLTNNLADVQWGTLWNFSNASDTTFDRSTISGNKGFATGGIYLDRGTLTLRDSILANSTTNDSAQSPTPDCIQGTPVATGTMVIEGNNLVEDPGSCPVAGGSGSLLEVDPQLQPSGLYGGSTVSLPPALNSPALDAGTSGDCPAIDQRSFSRPADGPDANSTATCDIGAVESRSLSIADATVTEGDGSGTTAMSFPITLSAPVPTTLEVTATAISQTADGSDYSCPSGCSATVTFGPNQAVAVFQIDVNKDSSNEGDETLRVELSNPTLGTLIQDDTGVGTIVSDDPSHHARSVDLKLRRHLKAKGRVTVTDTFNACRKQVLVKVQKKRAGGKWRTLKTVITTNLGYYKSPIPDKPGTYRSLAPKRTLTIGGDTRHCDRTTSPEKKHKH